MSDRNQQIDRYLRENLGRYVDETARLCALPSISAKGDKAEMAACAGYVAELLQTHGFQVDVFETPGQPVVVGRAEGASERTMLLYNHYDVQPVDPLDLWETPPFEPAVRDGALYARGAKDDKGEFVARLAAVDAVRAANDGELPCGVTFVVEGEEEMSSPHIAEFVQEHIDILRSHGSIWEEGGINPDGRPSPSLGARGILAVQLSVTMMTIDAHSGGASYLPNAAWRLNWALSTLKGQDERIRIAGFYDDARTPSESELELLGAMPDIEEWAREQYGVREFVRGVTGKELNSAVYQPTCNIAGLTAGYQGEGFKTVIPAKASVKIDFRLVPDQDPQDIFEKLRRHLDSEGFEDVELTWIGAMLPSTTPVDDPLVRLANETGEEVYGQPSLIIPIGGGSSPRYAFAGPLGIPIVTAGVGYWDNRTHAPNEHVRLSDMENAARHIARILDRFAGL